VDITRGEYVESELDSLIRRRDEKRRDEEGHRPSEEMYEESCRVFAAQRQQNLAWEWLRYHVQRQRAHRHTFALLDAMHASEIAKYEALLGITPAVGEEDVA
jgi:hypothetical protein